MYVLLSPYMDSIEVYYHKYEIKKFFQSPNSGKIRSYEFEYNAKDFNAYTAKCKQFYSMMI